MTGFGEPPRHTLMASASHCLSKSPTTQPPRNCLPCRFMPTALTCLCTLDVLFTLGSVHRASTGTNERAPRSTKQWRSCDFITLSLSTHSSVNDVCATPLQRAAALPELDSDGDMTTAWTAPRGTPKHFAPYGLVQHWCVREPGRQLRMNMAARRPGRDSGAARCHTDT